MVEPVRMLLTLEVEMDEAEDFYEGLRMYMAKCPNVKYNVRLVELRGPEDEGDTERVE